MKIVVLDGYAANPGDLSWEELKQLGDLTIYDVHRRNWSWSVRWRLKPYL